MLCRKPYIRGMLPFGCGQCFPCRLNRRRTWTHRLLLENFAHEKSCFATLTYNDENLPKNNSLNPDDTRKWLYKLRQAIYPLRLRYYLVGEYGDLSERAHYHAALYGVSYQELSLVQETWGKGHVMLGDLTPDSAQYICGYVTKKMTKKDDPRLKGRHPEFARMSNRPGIGAPALDKLIDFLTSDHGVSLIEGTGDVTTTVRHGKRDLPLGRYLISRLRQAIGGEEKFKEDALNRYSAEMLALYREAKKDPKNVSKSFRSMLLDSGAQKVLNMESRANIFKKKGTI